MAVAEIFTEYMQTNAFNPAANLNAAVFVLWVDSRFHKGQHLVFCQSITTFSETG